MGKTKQLLESGVICTSCGIRHYNESDISSINMFGYCRSCEREREYQLSILRGRCSI